MPASEPLDAEGFDLATNVSRETLERFECYADLLVKWNARFNLVGRSTLGDLWHRHMLDSAQLFEHLPPSVHRLVDFGSGAGFPGLVLAIMGVPDVPFCLRQRGSRGRLSLSTTRVLKTARR